jgi:hypothetical protein
MNPLAGFGNVDLILTGSFVSKLFLKSFRNGKFLFDSSDVKKNNLVSVYSGEIMGLNQDWFNIRQNDIYRLVLTEQIKRKYKIC